LFININASQKDISLLSKTQGITNQTKQNNKKPQPQMQSNRANWRPNQTYPTQASRQFQLPKHQNNKRKPKHPKQPPTKNITHPMNIQV
jgi:hypothetical protein